MEGLARIRDVTKDVMNALSSRLAHAAYESGVVTYHTICPWLRSRVQYSSSKKKLYYKAMLSQSHCEDSDKAARKKFLTEYEFMSKGGEQHASNDNSYVDDKGYRQNESSRPRALFAGVKGTYGLLTLCQGAMISFVRWVFPTYIHAMNSEELAERLNGVIKDDWVSIIYDGSSYDSLQTSEIMSIVDTA